MPVGRLDGRRIVITGAASGIGRRTAQLFASSFLHAAAANATRVPSGDGRRVTHRPKRAAMLPMFLVSCP